MKKNIEDQLRDEAEYAEQHIDAPLRDGTTITHRGQRSRVFSIRLGESEYTALEAAAEKAGLPASTLARTWITTRLAAEDENADAHDIADALATFSRRLAAM
ncbi:hypothetical protein [Gulosibacter molinativorax]|uniref:CopG family transcriptional regulator n=1 Tax=Gulosibacter molinativorax TaxID=256821 RepID=A0ABT7CB88_9MICO|nr:hypothetical protein [Gulosibacter molinativorax]MDJ1372471.1 hypothetical protein [Gulosibacter molinativorax]QUY63527.1 Hypotetical protein [Gulosibacter molinativorax]